MCNHAWKMCYLNIKIRRQFFMASMKPGMVRRMVAHFGQPGRSQNFQQTLAINENGIEWQVTEKFPNSKKAHHLKNTTT